MQVNTQDNDDPDALLERSRAALRTARRVPNSPPPSFHSRTSSLERRRQAQQGVDPTLADAFDADDDDSDDEADDRQRLVRSNTLNNAGTTLRSEASALGSNLTVVQIRQDFNKNLINVLQTGSSNLTLADTNEEAANSQALSTRQSIAVSALALANQSQQSVLQLLR